MDQADLKRIFLATALISVAVGAVGYLLSPVWGTRYLSIASLALVNWYALSKVLAGLAQRRTTDIALAALAKPILLLLLLLVAKTQGIEITSFLLGLNTFFLTLFGYMFWQSLRRSAVERGTLKSGASV